MPDVAPAVVPGRAGRAGTETSTEISIERVLLGHSPAEVVYDCR